MLSNDGNNGWLVIDKPLGMTSRAAVDRAAQWFPRKTPIGHTGTLDPLATGALVIAVGKATRLAEFVQDMVKTYTATFTLGATSATDDAEGPIEAVADADDPGRSIVEDTLTQFIGSFEQTPPAYSAAKINGRRAYAKARAGSAELPKAKLVRIDAITVVDCCFPEIRVEVRCGKGTYIRSLARDLGAKLGVGGYVSALRRDAVGDFTPAEATPLEARAVSLLPIGRGVATLPRIELSASEVGRCSKGQAIPNSAYQMVGFAACYGQEGCLVAVVRVLDENSLQPIKVFV